MLSIRVELLLNVIAVLQCINERIDGHGSLCKHIIRVSVRV